MGLTARKEEYLRLSQSLKLACLCIHFAERTRAEYQNDLVDTVGFLEKSENQPAPITIFFTPQNEHIIVLGDLPWQLYEQDITEYWQKYFKEIEKPYAWDYGVEETWTYRVKAFCRRMLQPLNELLEE